MKLIVAPAFQPAGVVLSGGKAGATENRSYRKPSCRQAYSVILADRVFGESRNGCKFLVRLWVIPVVQNKVCNGFNRHPAYTGRRF